MAGEDKNNWYLVDDEASIVIKETVDNAIEIEIVKTKRAQDKIIEKTGSSNIGQPLWVSARITVDGYVSIPS